MSFCVQLHCRDCGENSILLAILIGMDTMRICHFGFDSCVPVCVSAIIISDDMVLCMHLQNQMSHIVLLQSILSKNNNQTLNKEQKIIFLTSGPSFVQNSHQKQLSGSNGATNRFISCYCRQH